MTKTTIVLAEDHQIVRQGLRALLEAEPDFCVVGEASDGLEAVRLVERRHPSVLVIDITMPCLDGLEATRQISQRFPKTRVLILSMHASEGYVLRALKNGAFGYILKDCCAAELVNGVRAAAAGQPYLCQPLSGRAIYAYIEKTRSIPLDTYETLSTRQREVLQMAAQGYSSTQIGKRLFISPRTVEAHRSAMMRKLGLRNQADLIRYALQRGILPLD